MRRTDPRQRVHDRGPAVLHSPASEAVHGSARCLARGFDFAADFGSMWQNGAPRDPELRAFVDSVTWTLSET